MASEPCVLLVDDEAGILSALRRTLRREGFEIVTAESAAEALRILEERPVDAILSDQKMPGGSGLALLAEAARRFPDTARMLITGVTDEIPRDALEHAGVCALITKPWDDVRLKATLRRALAREGTLLG
jgi:response regulator RpfG family c-di-GMP phosphodiesterase